MAKKEDDKKLFAFLGVFLTVLGFIIVLAARKKDKYAMFYAKQGLVLFVAAVLVWAVSQVLAIVPILGWFAIAVMDIALIGLWIVGLVYSISGRMMELPFIGKFARKINL